MIPPRRRNFARPFAAASAAGFAATARAALALVLLASLVAAGGCRNDPPKPAGEPGTVDVTVGNKPFRLWVAATAQAREYGLMNRESMPPDRGMLFVFRREDPNMSFWMRNTLIPLDIIYLDAGGRVLSIGRGRPLDESPVPAGGPAQYVIELNAGAAAAAGLKPGDRVDLPKEAREPPGLE